LVTQKIISKLSEILSGMFIPDSDPDPDLDFYPSLIPDPGVKKAPDPGSATLLKMNAKKLHRFQNKI
jgi:hypothetical protein